jgi:hypothetical protein
MPARKRTRIDAAIPAPKAAKARAQECRLKYLFFAVSAACGDCCPAAAREADVESSAWHAVGLSLRRRKHMNNEMRILRYLTDEASRLLNGANCKIGKAENTDDPDIRLDLLNDAKSMIQAARIISLVVVDYVI